MSETPILDSLSQYQSAGKPNPVVLAVPPAEPLRVPGIGLLVPLPDPPVPWIPGTLARQYWGGPQAMTVCCSSDQSQHGLLLHLSAALPKRLPTWEQMTALRDCFFSDTVDAALILPRKADYVNVHAYCLHIWQ